MKLSKLPILALWISLIALVAACGNDTNTDSTTEISIKPTNFKQWEKQVRRYQPNIVVVDLWAMWCTSCIKRFPHMVAMSESYRDKGVRFISMNLDDHNDSQALRQANTFVKEMNARFDHFHMDENLIDAFEYFRLIGIPAVLVFDGDGNERFRLTGDNPNAQFTEVDIERAVLGLL
ncbi:TlpA disulfide reductase family protein [Aurantivibrio plasticivorans]